MYEHLLIDYMPKAGMIFTSRFHVLGSGNRDAVVAGVFRSALIIAEGRPTKAGFKKGRKNVQDFLVDLFINAAAEELKPLIENGAVLDFESALRDNTWWAVGRIGKSHFAELFHALVDARLAWRQMPRPPFDINEHSALARQIDQFLAGQKSWGRVGARIAFYDLAGGFKKEQEEEEEEEEDDDDDSEYDSSSEESDEDIDPITNAVDGAGVAAALACGEAVYSAAVDDNNEREVLDTLPQFEAMDIDDDKEEQGVEVHKSADQENDCNAFMMD